MNLGFAGLEFAESAVPFATQADLPSTGSASAAIRSANGIGIPANHR